MNEMETKMKNDDWAKWEKIIIPSGRCMDGCM
jgi:hypothetical protein